MACKVHEAIPPKTQEDKGVGNGWNLYIKKKKSDYSRRTKLSPKEPEKDKKKKKKPKQ